METVIVGMDQSEASTAALRWAVRHAASVGARLRLVHAFDVPDFPLGVADAEPSHDSAALRRSAEQYLREQAARFGAPPGTEVHVMQDRLPVRSLLDQAKHAALLVVGSRGRGGLTRLVLGSVSHQCVLHAPCPTVVVPVHVPETAEASPVPA